MKKNMFTTCITAGMAGAAAHFTHFFIDRKFPNGYRQMVSHTLGVMLNAPFFARLLAIFGFTDEQIRTIMLLYFGGFFWIAVGTFIGWTIEPDEERRNVRKRE